MLQHIIYFGLGVLAGGLIVDALYQRRIAKAKRQGAAGVRAW